MAGHGDDTSLSIDTDPSRLDVAFIHGYLTQTYWAQGRTLEETQTCMEHSLNFGLFLNQQQIGYARVLTDYVRLAYLLDVFISDEHRGKGYGMYLVEHILTRPTLAALKVWRLSTKDAHGLYARFGFRTCAEPENQMEWIRDK